MSKEFKGLWIQKEILLDRDLSAAEKILLAEIASLQKEGGCYASNDHFASRLGVKARQVRTYISSLVARGYVRVENPTSVRRRLWMIPRPAQPSNEVSAQIGGIDPHLLEIGYPGDGDELAPSADPIPAKGGGSVPRLATSTRQDRTAEPGNISTDPAPECRVTRHDAATEITEKKPVKNTDQNTQEEDGFILPDWLPSHIWDEWIAHNHARGGRPTAQTMKAQIQRLIELDRQGNPPKRVVQHAIEHGWKSLHELPPGVKPPMHKTLAGYIVGGGRIIL